MILLTIIYIYINYYLSHVVHVYFIFLEDGQCASGTTMILPPHVACMQLKGVCQV